MHIKEIPEFWQISYTLNKKDLQKDLGDAKKYHGGLYITIAFEWHEAVKTTFPLCFGSSLLDSYCLHLKGQDIYLVSQMNLR